MHFKKEEHARRQIHVSFESNHLPYVLWIQLFAWCWNVLAVNLHYLAGLLVHELVKQWAVWRITKTIFFEYVVLSTLRQATVYKIYIMLIQYYDANISHWPDVVTSYILLRVVDSRVGPTRRTDAIILVVINMGCWSTNLWYIIMPSTNCSYFLTFLLHSLSLNTFIPSPPPHLWFPKRCICLFCIVLLIGHLFPV